jgi:hypothetical protein
MRGLVRAKASIIARYRGHEPPASPHPISRGKASDAGGGSSLPMASKHMANHCSRVAAPSSTGIGWTRLYLLGPPISNCAYMAMTRGRPRPRWAGCGARTSIVPGTARSSGTANLCCGGIDRRSL